MEYGTFTKSRDLSAYAGTEHQAIFEHAGRPEHLGGITSSACNVASHTHGRAGVSYYLTRSIREPSALVRRYTTTPTHNSNLPCSYHLRAWPSYLSTRNPCTPPFPVLEYSGIPVNDTRREHLAGDYHPQGRRIDCSGGRSKIRI